MAEIIILIFAFLTILLPVPLNLLSFISVALLLFYRERKYRKMLSSTLGLSPDELKPLASFNGSFSVRKYAEEAKISWETAAKILEKLNDKGIVKLYNGEYVLTDLGREVVRRAI